MQNIWAWCTATRFRFLHIKILTAFVLYCPRKYLLHSRHYRQWIVTLWPLHLQKKCSLIKNRKFYWCQVKVQSNECMKYYKEQGVILEVFNQIMNGKVSRALFVWCINSVRLLDKYCKCKFQYKVKTKCRIVYKYWHFHTKGLELNE